MRPAPGVAPVLSVVPVLAAGAAAPVGTAVLHGRPLFLHATRSSREAFDVPVVVGAPRGERAGVSAALAGDGLLDVPVLPSDAGLGALLSAALGAGYALARTGPAGLLLVHDPRCPLTPAAALRDAVTAAAAAPGSVAVAARPMSDSVKELVGGLVRATVDRDRLRVLASPLVLPAALLHDLHDDGRLPACADVEDLLELVRSAGVPLVWVAAPALARRVDAASVALLEAWTAPA